MPGPIDPNDPFFKIGNTNLAWSVLKGSVSGNQGLPPGLPGAGQQNCAECGPSRDPALTPDLNAPYSPPIPPPTVNLQVPETGVSDAGGRGYMPTGAFGSAGANPELAPASLQSIMPQVISNGVNPITHGYLYDDATKAAFTEAIKPYAVTPKPGQTMADAIRESLGKKQSVQQQRAVGITNPVAGPQADTPPQQTGNVYLDSVRKAATGMELDDPQKNAIDRMTWLLGQEDAGVPTPQEQSELDQFHQAQQAWVEEQVRQALGVSAGPSEAQPSNEHAMGGTAPRAVSDVAAAMAEPAEATPPNPIPVSAPLTESQTTPESPGKLYKYSQLASTGGAQATDGSGFVGPNSGAGAAPRTPSTDEASVASYAAQYTAGALAQAAKAYANQNPWGIVPGSAWGTLTNPSFPIRSPADVDLLVERGVIDEARADVMRMVAARNQYLDQTSYALRRAITPFDPEYYGGDVEFGFMPAPGYEDKAGAAAAGYPNTSPPTPYGTGVGGDGQPAGYNSGSSVQGNQGDDMAGNIIPGGGGNVPTALPYVPQPPNTSAPFDQAGVLGLAIPGYTGAVSPSTDFGLGDDRSNSLAALSFPFLRGDPLRLPGKSTGNLASFIQSLLLQQSANQEGRLGQAESALRGANATVLGSRAGGLAESTLASIMGNRTPQADAIRAAEEATRQRTMNARDATLSTLQGSQASAGKAGGESQLATAAADFGTRSLLDQRLSDLNIRAAEVQRQEELANLGGANLGLQTLINQNYTPTDRLVQFLTGYENKPLAGFTEFNAQLLPLALSEELRSSASGFDIGGIGSLLTGAGKGAAGIAALIAAL